ncbi:hypothetical protein EI555_014370, partial [Monodon monoceros]
KKPKDLDCVATAFSHRAGRLSLRESYTDLVFGEKERESRRVIAEGKQYIQAGRTGHAEVVRVVYQPERISFEELLKVFWENHDPTQGLRQGNDHGSQYRSAIYPTSAEHMEASLRSKEDYQKEETEAQMDFIHVSKKTQIVAALLSDNTQAGSATEQCKGIPGCTAEGRAKIGYDEFTCQTQQCMLYIMLANWDLGNRKTGRRALTAAQEPLALETALPTAPVTSDDHARGREGRASLFLLSCPRGSDEQRGTSWHTLPNWHGLQSEQLAFLRGQAACSLEQAIGGARRGFGLSLDEAHEGQAAVAMAQDSRAGAVPQCWGRDQAAQPQEGAGGGHCQCPARLCSCNIQLSCVDQAPALWCGTSPKYRKSAWHVTWAQIAFTGKRAGYMEMVLGIYKFQSKVEDSPVLSEASAWTLLAQCTGATSTAEQTFWFLKPFLALNAMFVAVLSEHGFGLITTDIRERQTFYYAEDYHQQYLSKIPNGYCGLGGTGVSCPLGIKKSKGNERSCGRYLLVREGKNRPSVSEILGIPLPVERCSIQTLERPQAEVGDMPLSPRGTIGL